MWFLDVAANSRSSYYVCTKVLSLMLIMVHQVVALLVHWQKCAGDSHVVIAHQTFCEISRFSYLIIAPFLKRHCHFFFVIFSGVSLQRNQTRYFRIRSYVGIMRSLGKRCSLYVCWWKFCNVLRFKIFSFDTSVNPTIIRKLLFTASKALLMYKFSFSISSWYFLKHECPP